MGAGSADPPLFPSLTGNHVEPARSAFVARNRSPMTTRQSVLLQDPLLRRVGSNPDGIVGPAMPVFARAHSCHAVQMVSASLHWQPSSQLPARRFPSRDRSEVDSSKLGQPLSGAEGPSRRSEDPASALQHRLTARDLRARHLTLKLKSTRARIGRIRCQARPTRQLRPLPALSNNHQRGDNSDIVQDSPGYARRRQGVDYRAKASTISKPPFEVYGTRVCAPTDVKTLEARKPIRRRARGLGLCVRSCLYQSGAPRRSRYRGTEFGLSRMICDRSWQSDVDAARTGVETSGD
jgi:hypothetical protein